LLTVSSPHQTVVLEDGVKAGAHAKCKGGYFLDSAVIERIKDISY